jgi:hypothetical protein
MTFEVFFHCEDYHRFCLQEIDELETVSVRRRFRVPKNARGTDARSNPMTALFRDSETAFVPNSTLLSVLPQIRDH